MLCAVCYVLWCASRLVCLQGGAKFRLGARDSLHLCPCVRTCVRARAALGESSINSMRFSAPSTRRHSRIGGRTTGYGADPSAGVPDTVWHCSAKLLYGYVCRTVCVCIPRMCVRTGPFLRAWVKGAMTRGNARGRQL